MKHRTLFFLFFLTAFFQLTPAVAAGGKNQCLWEPGKGEGAKSKLTIVTASGEKLNVDVPAGCSGFTEHECSEWKGGQNATAVHFRAFKKKSANAFEAFVAVEKDHPELVWSGMTGLSGEFGERQGLFLDYEPAGKGAKNPFPILYSLDERVKLCGFGLVPLQVKMYDPKSAAFRPIKFDRLRRWKRGEKKGWGSSAQVKELPAYSKPLGLTGKFESAEEGGTKISLSSFLIFETSSSSLGEKGKTLVGVPPFSLTDGKAGSGWIEGSGGDGSGEFVTAKNISAYVPIKALEFSLAYGESKKDAKKFNGLKKIFLTTDKGKVFAVTIPSDPRKFPDKTVVVEFPEPLETKCISIILDEVWPAAASSGDHTFIGEVTPRTTIEDSEGFAKVANALVKSNKYMYFEKILKAMPVDSAAIIAGAWESFDKKTKPYLVEYTGGNLLAGEGGLQLAANLLDFVLKKKNYQKIHNLVNNFSKAPLQMLEWFESPPQPQMKEMASLCLHCSGYDEAAKYLIGYYLKETPPEAVFMGELSMLPFIRHGFESLLKDRSRLVSEASAETDPGALKNLLQEKGGWCGFLKKNFYGQSAVKAYDRKKMIALLHALYESGQVDCPAVLGQALWEQHNDFETKYYVLELFRKLVSSGKCAKCTDDLKEGGLIFKALESSDTQLKVAALEVLFAAEGVEEAVKGKIVLLLSDPSPQVRQKAVEVFNGLNFKDKAMEKKILALALEDFWPEVRKEAVMAMFKIKNIPEESLLKLLADPSPDVRKYAIRVVVDRSVKSKDIGKAIIKSAADKKMRWDVREEASLAVGRLCIGGFEKKLEQIAEDGLYPDSTEAEIAAAVGAIASLGMLGWEGALGILNLAVLPGIRSEIRLAAIEALGSIGGEEAKEMLMALSESPEKSIRETAALALENIKSGKKPHCK